MGLKVSPANFPDKKGKTSMYYHISMPFDKQAEYQVFAKEKLGFEFNDISLFITALTHRSYVNEHRSNAAHNERLEFLGDAILELVTSDYLFRTYHQPEGVMTAWRAALVNTDSISAAGVALGYPPLVRLSRGESAGSDRAHAVIYADCFEAIIGAIYLDQGYQTASDFIHKHIIVKLPEILENDTWRDPKSLLQEIVQSKLSAVPDYQLITASGPDHDRVFTVRVVIGEEEFGIGTGHSKQEAQVAAAREAIQVLRKRGVYEPKKFEPIAKEPRL